MHRHAVLMPRLRLSEVGQQSAFLIEYVENSSMAVFRWEGFLKKIVLKFRQVIHMPVGISCTEKHSEQPVNNAGLLTWCWNWRVFSVVFFVLDEANAIVRLLSCAKPVCTCHYHDDVKAKGLSCMGWILRTLYQAVPNAVLAYFIGLQFIDVMYCNLPCGIL